MNALGWWKYGKKEGSGTYYFADTGMKFVGTWSNGSFLKGKWVYPNGTFFEGDFDKNQPKGKGNYHIIIFQESGCLRRETRSRETILKL